MEPTDLLEAGAAAERLGVSASGLRRYAALYEQVHGELPRRVNTKSRLYPGEALERLAAARRLVDAERCKSILEGLEALEQGVQLDLPGTEVQLVSSLGNDAAHTLLGEMRAVREELAAVRAEVRELKALPPADGVSSEGAGLLTRLAARVEGWLKWVRE